MPIDQAHLKTWSYAELRADGTSRTGIERALETGQLVRARRDHYVDGTASPALLAVVRVGGRLDCVSLLEELDVFVEERGGPLHVQIPRTRRKLRSPQSRTVPLDGRRHSVVTHWRTDPVARDSTIAEIPAAIAQAVLCQRPRMAIATLDSALHRGVLREHELSEVFAHLPAGKQQLRNHLDGRAESGSETLARLIARTFGVSVEVQVEIDGVGRVDLVIDRWIVVECDSREFHGGWEAQERDRRRDLELARRGHPCIRPTAHQIFTEPQILLRALEGLLRRRGWE